MFKGTIGIGCIALGSVCCESASAFEKVNFRDFASTSFGSVAYVGTAPGDVRKTERQVLGPCESLPKSRTHYFLINHYRPERNGSVGYFLAEVLLVKKGNADRLPAIQSVEIYRNENWSDQRAEFGPRTLRESDAKVFYEIHSDPNGGEKLPEAYKRWHARPDLGAKTSFELSNADIRQEPDQPGQQIYKYRLIKAALSAKTWSTRTPFFYFQTGDAELGLLRLTAPSFDLEPAIYHFSFGSPCS